MRTWGYQLFGNQKTQRPFRRCWEIGLKQVPYELEEYALQIGRYIKSAGVLS